MSSSVLEADGPVLSVILPVYKAMPYLPIAVRDVLKQDLGGGSLELLCSWDGAGEADWEWLVELAGLLGTNGAVEEVEAPTKGDGLGRPKWTSAGNPASSKVDEESANPLFPKKEESEAMSASAVALSCRGEHRLRVVRYTDKLNRGQGSAMSLALARSSAQYVAQMESDDARPNTGAFKAMLEALQTNEEWDGVCTDCLCFGTYVSAGMAQYVEWQNSMKDPKELARGRFIEIPALHQTALFRRSAIETTLAETQGSYRDGPYLDDAKTPDLDTPVDMWWWLTFFHLGLKCGRISSPPQNEQEPAASQEETDVPLSLSSRFFCWRQHPRQRTRQHGRLSIENLRRIKIEFLLRAFHKEGRPVLVVSVGKTLLAWEADLKAHPNGPKNIRAFEWRPAKRLLTYDKNVVPDALLRNCIARGGQISTDDAAPLKVKLPLLRIFAYGEPRARARVKLQIPDWDDDLDIFAA